MTTSHLPECGANDGSMFCICAALRACEQRVLDAARERLLYVALNYSTDPEFHALAAIDALRNPPSLPPTTGRALKY